MHVPVQLERLQEVVGLLLYNKQHFQSIALPAFKPQ